MNQTIPGIKQDSISKITKAKRAGDVAQVVEHLPSKGKALSSKSIPPKPQLKQKDVLVHPQ
jgi:hypothetical protein